ASGRSASPTGTRSRERSASRSFPPANNARACATYASVGDGTGNCAGGAMVAAGVPVQAPTGTPAAIIAPPAQLPVPSPTEAYVAQARALFAGGKLRDALRSLDRVPVGDALRPD